MRATASSSERRIENWLKGYGVRSNCAVLKSSAQRTEPEKERGAEAPRIFSFSLQPTGFSLGTCDWVTGS